MPAYETTIMISTMTSRRRTVDLLKRAINHIIDDKGVVMGVYSLGTRALAYDIRRKQETHSTANFAIIKSYASPQTMLETQKQLRFDEDVLRFMTIKQSR